MLRHLRNAHKFRKTNHCNKCLRILGHESTLYNHRALENSSASSSTFVSEIEWASVGQISKVVSALYSFFRIVRLEVQQQGSNPSAFMMRNRSNFAVLIDREIAKNQITRVSFAFKEAF